MQMIASAGLSSDSGKTCPFELILNGRNEADDVWLALGRYATRQGLAEFRVVAVVVIVVVVEIRYLHAHGNVNLSIRGSH